MEAVGLREMRSWEGSCRGKSGHGFEQNTLNSCVRFLNNIKNSPRDLCWDLTVNGRWLRHSPKLKQNLGRWQRAGWDKQASASTGCRPNRGLSSPSAVNRTSHDGSPEPERGPSAEENWLWFWLGFFKESKKGVMLHTDFPEGLAEVSAGHQEFQGVLVRALKRNTAFVFPAPFISILRKREKKKNQPK